MNRTAKLVEFFIYVLKCFFILLFLGYILPKIIDSTTYYFEEKYYQNSVFVSSILGNNHKINNYFMFFIKNYFNGCN